MNRRELIKGLIGGVAVAAGCKAVPLAGEKVGFFPNLPKSSDFSSFLDKQLNKVAAGVNMTYEQVTMDLSGVNYSSIRAGLTLPPSGNLR